MSRAVRLGAVSYLNARPLVYGLDERPAHGAHAAGGRGAPGAPRVSVRFDVPSVCAKLLADAEIDLGLIPTISYLDRPGDRIVPGVAIASHGPVASVALFTRKPVREIRTVALDTSSRTSVALTWILCAKQFEISPTFASHPPDLPAMLASCDAALLIGDSALFADHRALGAEKIDLGQAWTDLTGRPFVWAFWAGRPEAADAGLVTLLQQARDAGVANSDRVADRYCHPDSARQAVARRYLRDNMHYGLSEAMLDGLQTYFREATSLGLISRAGPLEFFE